MKQVVKGMDTEEKRSVMDKMMNEFFTSMTPEEKKELVQEMMPKMTEKMFEGLDVEDKQVLFSSMVPTFMIQMFSGENGLPVANMMRNMLHSDNNKEEKHHLASIDDNFKPWQFCPCSKLCTDKLLFSENSAQAGSSRFESFRLNRS